ncbi:hypothetical protein F0562_002988 [Nyssa sinensis]|uniref:Uncharacterized protein n=1 Tax=Nyssa sinensis TaxID=561372 RepID=A0A5J5BT59_9ASTE|nr:hypothetical protein F0562_002988 [Nyssa sinensis]
MNMDFGYPSASLMYYRVPGIDLDNGLSLIVYARSPRLRLTYGEKVGEEVGKDDNVDGNRKGGGITNENKKNGGNDREVSEDDHGDSDDSDWLWFNENIDFGDDDTFAYYDEENEKWN